MAVGEFDYALIREQLAEALGAAELDGQAMHAYDYTPGSPTLPAAIVRNPDAVDFHAHLRNGGNVLQVITVAVSRADDRHAQRRLNAAVSWPGLAGQIESYSPSVGDKAWRTLKVEQAREFRTEDVGDTTCLCVDFVLNIFAA